MIFLGLHVTTSSRCILKTDVYPREVSSVPTLAVTHNMHQMQTPSSKPVKQWNGRKADWNSTGTAFLLISIALTYHFQVQLSLLRHTKIFAEFCFFAAEETNPRGRKRKYTPCWDEECEKINKDFNSIPDGPKFKRTALA